MKVLFIDGIQSEFIADDFLIEGGDFVGVSGGQRAIYPAAVFGGATVEIKDYTPPAPVPEPPAPELKWVSRYAFMARFTADELAFIKIAGMDDPTKPMPERIAIQKINVMWDMVMASAYIDLNRPDTRAGVKSMEAFGLLATGRADEILDAPVQDFERYKG